MPPWRIWQLEQGLVQPKPNEVQRLWNALSTDRDHEKYHDQADACAPYIDPAAR
ncbi:hypothetical protein MYX04_13275 [Nitrospiraceae bacterium AH_259_D15_M11_P09]|nr:hypothetical protein [Nitrospiraceae bacterium AH_259_D15_M11_P09]